MKDPTAVKHYDYIDAVRGIAIILVVIVHVSHSIPLLPERISKILAKGQYGVQMFFIASALTLFMSYTQRKPRDGTNTNKFFFLRRFFRIAPMYYLAILLYSALTILLPFSTAPNNINFFYVLLAFFFLNGIYPSNGAINYLPPGGWSVATEMVFYLLIPLLFRMISSLRKSVFFLLTCITGSILLKAALKSFITMYTHQNYLQLESWLFYFWLPNQLPVFAMGISLYYLQKKYYNLHLRRSTASLLILVCLLGAALIITGSFRFNMYYIYSEHLQLALLFSCFIFILSKQRLQFFVNRFTINIGKTSFSLYLIHFVIIRIIAYPINRIITNSYLAFIVILTLTLLAGYFVSQILYRTVEEKGIETGKKIINKIKLHKSTSQAIHS